MALPLLLTLGTLLVFLAAAGVPRPAWRAPVRFLYDACTTPGGHVGLAWVLGILLFNTWETSVDPILGPSLRLDFTPWIHGVEGDLVVHLQRLLLGHALAPFWVWLYIFGYPALLLVPGIVLHAQGRRQLLRAYIGAFLFNYVAALPFYLFVPVVESGLSHLAAVDPILEQVWPRLLGLLRSSSAPDNCFPSLHTSCSLTAAFFCLRHGPPRLARMVTLLAVLIVASIYALGVHWVLDGVAGVGLAVLAVRLGPALAERLTAPGAAWMSLRRPAHGLSGAGRD